MFKQKARLSAGIVQDVFYALEGLEDGYQQGSMHQKNGEELARNLAVIKGILQGDGDLDCGPDAFDILLREVCQDDFILLLASKVRFLDWDSRKNVVQIWYNLVKPSSEHSKAAVVCILNHPDIFSALLQGYESKEAAMNSGTMIREALRHPVLARSFLNHEDFPKLFHFIESSSFDIASDAFMTLKDSLRRHSDVASEFLGNNFVDFFSMYEELMTSQNYVTKRQSVKLLGELLLDRGNVNVMLRYINDPKNLKLVMLLLRDKSKNIQFEAFHVFKVFVANPTKADPILKMLYRNKRKLLEYLQDFHNDREDEEFQEEKELLVREISTLDADD